MKKNGNFVHVKCLDFSVMFASHDICWGKAPTCMCVYEPIVYANRPWGAERIFSAKRERRKENSDSHFVFAVE